LLSSKSSSLLFLLLFSIIDFVVILGAIIDEVIISVGIFTDDLVLEHLFERLDVLLEKFRHFLHSECGCV
jgi:hypothetical protein